MAIDIINLKKKFPTKINPGRGGKPKKSSKAAVEAIRREYELKKAEMAGNVPLLKRGPLFYGMIVLLLIVIGSLVVPQLMNGGITLGKARIERSALQAQKAMTSLTLALGRYKFHVGQYPTTEEGLAVLAYRRPEELRKIRRAHPTWNGPYVDHIVKDPWGKPYVYETRPEGGNPILYSCGPDRKAGTLDDLLPDQAAFEQPFRDTTWTNHWAPAELRGIVVAPDEETKKRVEATMREYD